MPHYFHHEAHFYLFVFSHGSMHTLKDPDAPSNHEVHVYRSLKSVEDKRGWEN